MSVKQGAWAALIVKAICAGIIFVATVQTLLILGPIIETRFFPVVGRLQILRIDTSTDGRALVYAAFEKKRQCEYLGIAWYATKPDRSFERIPVITWREAEDDSSPTRPVGYQKAGPWIVGIAPEDLMDNSFAELTHRCHSFYTTTTRFFP